MDSSLRESFARLGPIRAVGRVSSGSPAVFVLRLRSPGASARTVEGALALTRRGLTLLKAKRAMDELIGTGRTFVDLPLVEEREILVAQLAKAGIAAERACAPT